MKSLFFSIITLIIAKGSILYAIPGVIIQTISDTPVISLESISFEQCTVLRKFDVQKHIQPESLALDPDYFRYRNRTVILTSDQKTVIKVWEEKYPSADLFLEAFQAGFYDGISKIQGIIFDKNGKCRGYITPYMISRKEQRNLWNEKELVLERNAAKANIFSNMEKQPQIYKDLFYRLVNKSKETGFFSVGFSPDNVVIDSEENRLYLIDLEDVYKLKSISLENKKMRMILNYNPKDYLEIFNLL